MDSCDHFKLKKRNVDISIIISIFGNFGSAGAQCINSVRKQSFKNFEILVILDGPNKDKNQIVQHIENSEFDYRIISRDRNEGLFKARILGASLARGKYLAFLDHDDSYEENFLAEMFKTANQTGSDIVECKILNVHENGNRDFFHRFSCGDIRQGEDILSGYFNGLSHNNIWNKLVRRSLWETTIPVLESRLKFNYINFCDDMLFTINLYRHAKIYSTNCATHYNYNKKSVSASSPESINSIFGSLVQLKSAFQYIKKYFWKNLTIYEREQFKQREVFWVLKYLNLKLLKCKCNSISQLFKFIYCRMMIFRIALIFEKNMNRILDECS